MRIGILQLWQETNTFNPLPTTRREFEAFGLMRGAEIVEKLAATNEPGGFIQSLRAWPEQPEIVGLVRDAQENKASGERVSQWFGKSYTLFVVAAFVVSLVARVLFHQAWDTALYASFTLLVALSPCALVISSPATTLSGASQVLSPGSADASDR